MIQVVELPRDQRLLYEGGLLGCIQYCHGVASKGMTRLAMGVAAPPPPDGPDVVACVSLRAFDDWLTRALEVFAAWDDRWLLVESMPRRHRAEARDELAKAIADAILAAAVSGIDAVGGTAGDGELLF